jgi:hypothetical protein
MIVVEHHNFQIIQISEPKNSLFPFGLENWVLRSENSLAEMEKRVRFLIFLALLWKSRSDFLHCEKFASFVEDLEQMSECFEPLAIVGET